MKRPKAGHHNFITSLRRRSECGRIDVLHKRTRRTVVVQNREAARLFIHRFLKNITKE